MQDVVGQSHLNTKIKFGERLIILSYIPLIFLTPTQNLNITKCATKTLLITPKREEFICQEHRLQRDLRSFGILRGVDW